jgi:ADP-L-glycero-D-manno-heptose 6-epimerase
MIVVTGGAGFIGSAIIWELNRRGFDDILVVDTLGTGEKWKNLRHLRFSDFIDKDRFIDELEKDSFGKIEGIIHMGACTDTKEKDADFLLKNNYEYTKRLAIWAVKKGVRFLYASSAATYGDGSEGFSDDHSLLPKLRPLNMYGYSKHLFDLWALRNGYLEKIAGVKYFNVFGPNEYHKGDMRSVVHKAYEQIVETGKVRLFKSHRPDYRDGWQMRDFLYVKDAVKMTLFLYERHDLNGIFNVGRGEARSFYELVSAVFRAMGKEVNIEYIDMPQELREKYQYFTEADLSKLKGAGYGDITPLEDAIEDYVKNYLLTDDPYLKPED